MADTFNRNTSSISTAMSSFESSLRMLGPPLKRNTTPPENADGITVRRIPRVTISVSAYRSKGTMVRSTRSNPVVGPWKYP